MSINSQTASEELRSFVERMERLDVEAKDIANHKKEVMAEAKGRGYDTKVLRRVLALRKRDQNEVDEEEAVLEMYLEALGMSYRALAEVAPEDDVEGVV